MKSEEKRDDMKSKEKIFNNNDLYFINKINKKPKIFKEKIKKIIDNRKLDEEKKESVFELVKCINKKNTTVAVNGGQGSGKTSVIDIATKEIFLPKKNNLNIVILCALFLMLIPSLFCTNLRKWTLNKIYLRRWKFIKMNMWNIFGHRALSEYKDIKKTAYLKHIAEYKNGIENNFKKISSFHVDEGKIDDPNNDKASFLFIKKTIWRAVFSEINRWNPFISRLKNSIFINSYAINKEKNILKIVLLNIFSIMLISFIFGVPIFILAKFIFNQNIYESILYSFFSLIPGNVIKIVLFYSMKNKEIYNDNDFFVDPISNTAIQKYITKLSKNKILIIHISELDRLNYYVNDYVFIKYIVESISLAYNSPNLNIIIETDHKILDKLSKKSENTDNLQLDIKNKIFKKIINIRSFNLKALLYYLLHEYNVNKNNNEIELEKDLFKEFFQNLDSKILKTNGIKSWRNADNLCKVFGKVNLQMGFNKLKKSDNINYGFFEIYKFALFDEYLKSYKINEFKTKIKIMNKTLEINGYMDQNFNKKNFMNTIFKLFNPHIILNKENLYYQEYFSKKDYLDLFCDLLAKKIPNDLDVISDRVLRYILINIDKDNYKKLPLFNYKSFWKDEFLINKTFTFIRNDFFIKLKKESKIDIINEISSEEIIENNSWIAESLNEFINEINDDVFIRYTYTTIFNLDIKIHYKKIALNFNQLHYIHYKFLSKINDDEFIKEKKYILKYILKKPKTNRRIMKKDFDDKK